MLWLMLMLHSAQKQGKRGEGFTCSNSHTKGQTQMGEGGLLELHARAPHRPLHHSLAPCLCLLLSLPAPELPLPLQPFSWGLRLQELGQGGHTGALGAHFNFHPQNHYK